MKKATDCAVEAIAHMSEKVTGKDQIAKVAAISAGDEEVRQLMLWRRFLTMVLSQSRNLRQ